jgi:TPR repeat protein
VKEAIRWYLRAWQKKRESAAANNLARIYETLGNLHLEIQWMRRAASIGD